MSHNDLTGQTFGRLTVIEESGRSSNGSVLWLCRCSCGKMKTATASHLLGGYIQSCGCLNKQRAAENCISRTKHGDARHGTQVGFRRLYRVWHNMMDRCYRENAEPYKNYGGRGIRVCSDWHDYARFKEWATAAGYDSEAPYGQCTLDRINPDGNYEPSNCRWVSMKVQADNRRNGRFTNGRYAPATDPQQRKE